jgi:hypothetical protein
MSVTVRIPTQLRTLTGGAGEVEVEGASVGEALKALDAAHPGLADRLFDDAGGRSPSSPRSPGADLLRPCADGPKVVCLLALTRREC